MTKTNMADVVALVALVAGVDARKVNENSFLEGIEVDSLDRFVLAQEVEERWAITLEDQEVVDCETVGDVKRLIDKKRDAK